MKKRIVVIIVVIIGCICSLSLVIKRNQNPYEVLKNKTSTSIQTYPNKFLYQANIGNREYIIFYINGNNKMACANMKRTLFSYEILNTSGELFLVNDNERITHFFSSYNNGGSRDWIDWGIIYDEKINKVMVNGIEANIVVIESYNLRIYYLLGDETEKIIPPEHELIY